MPIPSTRKTTFAKGHYTSGVGKTSKTRDPKCSDAMSKWKSGGTLTHELAQVLAGCRAKAKELKSGVKAKAAEKPSDIAKRLKSKVESVSTSSDRPASRASKERQSATVGNLIPVKHNGLKGKDARILMHDGSEAPEHIQKAKIPPAWKEVHASDDPKSDLIATGKDEKGRVQKIYNDEFHMRNAALKFSRIRDLVSEHDSIMEQVHKDRKSNDPAVKDPAELTWLIEQQGTRPGSRSDTGGKVKAYGATTLEHHHVVEVQGKVRLRFIGKEGVKHNHVIRDPELAQRMIERKRAAEASANSGKLFGVHEGHLNDYIKKLGSGGYTAKDFRTHLGTKLAAEKIKEIGLKPAKDMKTHKKRVKEVSEHVSGVLGNKPKQAHDSYIDPAVWSVWSHPSA